MKMNEENNLADDNEEVCRINYNLKGGRVMSAVQPEERVVITGISGAFPSSSDVNEYKENLYNKVDMVQLNRRWNVNHPEIPTRSGTIPDIQQYDTGFFGVHERQSHSLDPMIAVLQEKTIEAIFDAGLHPSDLENTKTGVFVGVCFSENDKPWFFDNLGSKTYAVTGSERSMAAHRLSYFLKLKGPSHTTDTACSSSLYAFDHAYRSLRSGEIDSAIVAGTNLCMHPFVSLQFSRLGVLSKDGSCKAFDEQGNGYARSEAVAVLILQKAKDAKRIYAEVVHVKTNCDGYKEQGITFPSKAAQMKLMNEFYDECEVDRYSLNFLEAHGTGTFVGDPEECGAIEDVFTKGRTEPLLMGSVKSNIGHCEPASGVCSIIKCIIGMETGFIPPNIHYNKPRPEIKGLLKGTLKVVTDKTPFQNDRGLVGINSFGFGGGNCHLLLRWNPKLKVNSGRSTDNLPRLVCLSGRTEEAVLNLLDSVTNNKFDAEYVRLLHDGFRKNVSGHWYRGYNIFTNSGEITRSTKFLKHFPSNSPPLYLAFDEMNDWCNIGRGLMALPAFLTSITRIQKALLKHQINILDILMKETPIQGVNQSLGSVVIHLGLIDVLNLMEIKLTGVIGHSFGELLSAYNSGTVSLEDTVYYAFLISTSLWEILKSNVEGHNIINGKYENADTTNGNYTSNGNVIENGSETTLHSLQQSLKNKSLMQIKDTFMENVLKESFKKDTKRIKYFADAIFKSVTQSSNRVNANSVIMKLSNEPLDGYEDCSIISVFNKPVNGYLEAFLKYLGSLYELGYNPQVSKLYPSIEYPVGRGTSMISPYFKWNHRKPKYIPQYDIEVEKVAYHGARIVRIQGDNPTWKFLRGHVIDGRNLFPATGYLYLVLETFSIMKNLSISVMQVCFENCKFLTAVTVPEKGFFSFHISIQLVTGNFEVVLGNTLVVTGKISLLGENSKFEDLGGYNLCKYRDSNSIKLKSKDIYKELRLRGYNYKGEFRGIEECDTTASNATIKWDNNWITFMDNMLQLKILQSDTRLLYVPTYISKLTIMGKIHLELVTSEVLKGHKTPLLQVSNDSATGIVRCGGINIYGLIATSIQRRKILGVPVLEKYKFVPNHTVLDVHQSVRVNIQIILENALTVKIKAVELIDEATEKSSDPLSPIIKSALDDQPLIYPLLTILSKTPLEDTDIEVVDKALDSENDCLLVIASNVLNRPHVLRQASKVLVENGFIITRESHTYDISRDIDNDLSIYTVHRTPNETLLLLRKQPKVNQSKYIKISSTDVPEWLPSVQNSITKEKTGDILLYSENEPKSGILGLVNCLRREPPSKDIRCLFMMDKADDFDPQSPFYTNQLKKHMAVNLFKDGQWGTYRHLLLNERQDVESEHCFANITVKGDLSSLRWLEGPYRHNMEVPPEKQLIHVYYGTLNFRDIMTASGKINVDVVTQDRLLQECVQGFEYAGRDTKGNRVTGMVPCGALSTLIVADSYMNFPIPDSWSLEEAATVPVVYGTVIYALLMRGAMVRGESILIHSGTGGVGQAAIRIALHYGCQVFTTVGTQEKREFLKKTFPQLQDHNIGNSHDESFEQLVYRGTNGRGVDLVLNSLAEEKLVASVRCLAKGGRFIEIGKFDLANNHQLSLLLFQKEATFLGVMLDQLFYDPPVVKKQLRRLLISGIDQGYIKPLNRTVFKYDQLEQAFRFMASGKHMGKVLVQIREPEDKLLVPPSLRKFPGIARVCCDPEKVYIITGGLGGFGLELSDWLILRGARKVVLTSRKGVTTGYQNYRLNIWKTYGVIVKISKADITTKQGCEELIRETLQLGRIDAIFNLAVVLADGLFENQTTENFITSFGPKAYATEYLDEITRKLCPDLSEFVVFSSVSCGRGNAGQTNYGMSNSVMERICEDRKRAGYPALSIEWGAVGEVGLVAEMLKEDTEIKISGTLQQRISSCLQVMDTLMRQKDTAIVSSIVVAEKKGINAADNIVDAVINILGVNDSKSVSLHSTLAELGMDSMTAVEIKQVLERDFEVFLSAKDIRTMTLAKLKEIQNQKLEEDGKGKETVVQFGMEMMFRQIGDETQNSVPYLEFNSNVSQNSDGSTLLLFPGIEGVASVYQDLGKKLNAYSVGVQFDINKSDETVVETAQSLIPTIKKFFPKDEFLLISYSFGTLVALEAISILEADGYTGTLLIIDGAPMLMKQMAINLGIESVRIFETAVICQQLSLYIPLEEISPHKENIFKCETWDERLNLAVEIIKDRTIHKADYLKQVSTSIYNRTKTIMKYTPSYTKIRSNVKLFKANQSAAAGLSEDYGLSEYCEKIVEVQTFAGNHVTILNSEELATAINSSIQQGFQ